jgi:formylmethanofuran dehydrogenase subunit E
MPEELLEDPPVRAMLEWMMSAWGMTKSDLARMFQRTQSTIHHWLNTGQVSHRNLMKIRSSYYFLHDAKDPHANERRCERCGKWLPQKEFREGKAICHECENSRTLQYYWAHREEQLTKRKAKNWYNRRSATS